MGLISGAGAASAATDIIEFIDKKLDENKDNPEVLRVLSEVRSKASEVQKDGQEGWY